MQYILFQAKCLETPNASHPFLYDYILADHPALIEKYLDKTQIESVVVTKNYHLVKLRKPASTQYTYISREEVQKYETRQ
jgi:hypothetical protein